MAPTLDSRCDEKGCLFVTQLIEGQAPKDKKRARAFLRKLTPLFQEVGLPTWQVLPWNPKATGNLIETPDGSHKIIDLESGVVNPMMPIGQWIDAIKAGLIPVFDDVFVAKTRKYIENHRDELEAALGPEGLQELQRATDEYQDCAEEWHKSELRIWGRLLQLVLKVGSAVLKPIRLLWPPALIGAIRSAFRQARAAGGLTRDWGRGAAQRLVEEGSLDPEEAEEAISGLETPETVAALGHLGAHIAITIVLFGPFESIARFGWTIFFRLRSEVRALLGRGSSEELRGARKIHTLTVAVLSALPFVGTFAYLAAEPLRKNRPLLAVLLDEALRKLPFGLYRRQHLAVLTCWLACSGPTVAPRIIKSRWHSLRPHHLVAWVRDAAERLRPHRTLVTSILAANMVALIIAGTVGGLTDTLPETFGEFGPMQTLKAAESLLAGVAGYYIYTRFWRLPQAGQRVDAPGSFFWIISGAGLVWLGIDDYFGIHERVGDLLEEGLGATVPLLNNFDDLILLGYGIIGLTVVAVFLGELMRSRAVFPLVVTGIMFLVVSQAIDFFAPEGTELAGVENPTNIIGAGFLLSAYLVKLREVWSELPGAVSRLPTSSLTRKL